MPLKDVPSKRVVEKEIHQAQARHARRRGLKYRPVTRTMESRWPVGRPNIFQSTGNSARRKRPPRQLPSHCSMGTPGLQFKTYFFGMPWNSLSSLFPSTGFGCVAPVHGVSQPHEGLAVSDQPGVPLRLGDHKALRA